VVESKDGRTAVNRQKDKFSAIERLIVANIGVLIKTTLQAKVWNRYSGST